MPPLSAIGIENYRSVHKLFMRVGAVNVFVGNNGVGKTNLYKSLELLQQAALGRITRAVSEEGGVESVMWAGDLKVHEKKRIILRADLGDLSYKIELGLPNPISDPALPLETMVREETLTLMAGRKPVVLMQRKGPSAFLRSSNGARVTYDNELLPSETALASIRDGGQFPELDLVRRALADWRFYHTFRSDRDSQLRRPSPNITTPTLSSDGSDLAAVFATLKEIRKDTYFLQEAVADAFPGSNLLLEANGQDCRFSLQTPEIRRPFPSQELSDGTLQYLALLGAMLSYRLPAFIALNEPEASLHPDLLEPLAKVIAKASERSQIWLVTHSEQLADHIAEHAGAYPRRIYKENGHTGIDGLKITGEFVGEEY
ncbi:DNA replication and repair protein RecF [Pseudovibrio axinellae]|uniref:DNA replication and repair protein RecF n=2 Tax=Pseudovibrio axinellae TaxID=989403 RepID=A0A165XTW5_9HYPH|nr:DNA replication and repair protein RecF [Pseudovibrio axinellae]SER12780.1 Predicted ATPase [Pseudovibrio axinellae]